VRSLDSTRFVTSAVPVNFLEIGETGSLNPLFDPDPVPEDSHKDKWGVLTQEFNRHLDVVGYNYLRNRYAVDQERFPERVIAGTETFPHQAYAYWKETERLPNVIGDFVWTAFDYLGEAGIGAVNFEGQVGLYAVPYPYHLATCGDFDICGFKRPQSYFRDLLWGVRSEPFIAVLDPEYFGKPIGFNPWGWEPVIDHWTFPGQEGQTTQVDVYAIDDEVELFINCASVGRTATKQNKASFEVNYQPGTIMAVGYSAGKETGRTQLTTASKPAALRLSADRETLKTQFGDLAYVTIEVVDETGVIVNYGEPEILVEVSGVGELIALGEANPLSEESYVDDHRKAYQGRLLAIIRTTGENGKINLQAKANGLAAAQIELQVN
jgi:beta-galactosidase